MTHKDISQFKKDVSSDISNFIYDLEQSSTLSAAVHVFYSITIQVFSKNMNLLAEFCYNVDLDSNVTGNYLEFSKKLNGFKEKVKDLKAFKQQV